jgi:DNA-binding transcriptional ArsR family regulator
MQTSSVQHPLPTQAVHASVPTSPPSVAALQARADEAATLLKALANPDRLLLLCHLLDGEHCVGDLGMATGIGQPSLSQQLAVLRSEQLVEARRHGQRVLYRVTSPAALAVLHTLHGLFCTPPAPPDNLEPA